MNNNGQVILLIAYLFGQAVVALVAPLVSYFLTRPHLKRVEQKVEDVAVQTNGAAKKLEDLARSQGFAAGKAEAEGH